MAGVCSHNTTPSAEAKTPIASALRLTFTESHTLRAASTIPGYLAPGMAHFFRDEKFDSSSLFFSHHRASLTWEWEEPRFRGWCVFTQHHANRPTATELTWRRRAHPPHGYYHDSRPTATGLAWRARAMRTPTGLFHHRASLTWEWEEPRFRGWCVFTQHHAERRGENAYRLGPPPYFH